VIRINLLPVKAAKKREAGQRQLLVLVVGLVGLVVVLGVFHTVEAGAIDTMRRRNTALQADIDKLKEEVGDIAVQRAQKQELIEQDKAIAALRAGQTGPVWVMRELSQMLSPGGQPTMDAKQYEETVRRDPSAAYNPTWDPRRLALIGYVENKGAVKIEGSASDNADVAEFLKRLSLSQYFKDVRLLRSEATAPGVGAVRHVRFTVNCRVIYQ
jgi:type IV pilus assembly protein PilN